MTITELYAEAEKAGKDVGVEMYESDQTSTIRLHTDNCWYVGGLGFSDNEPTDETHEVIDWTAMDAEEYNRTLNANTSETMDSGQVLVAIVAPKVEEEE